MSDKWNETDKENGSSSEYSFWAEQVSKESKHTESGRNSDSNRNDNNEEEACTGSDYRRSGRTDHDENYENNGSNGNGSEGFRLSDTGSARSGSSEQPAESLDAYSHAAAAQGTNPEPNANPGPDPDPRPQPFGQNAQGGSYRETDSDYRDSFDRSYSYTNGAIPEEPVRKKGGGFWKKLGKAAASAIVFGLVAGAVFIGFNSIYYKLNPDARTASSLFGGNENLNLDPPGKNTPKISSTTVSSVKTQDYSLIAQIVEQTEPSVVTITSTFVKNYSWFGQQYSDESSGGGSGIIVGENAEELLIATNNHVVESANKIAVKFADGTEGLATIKGRDSIADLAVISVPLDGLSSETKAAIKVATLGSSDEVKVGELTIAIGNALGYGQSVTVGYVSAKDREVTVDGNTMILLQTDAAINPGNSGGALLNARGEVIGINSVKYAQTEVEGIGFAIPISRAYPILNEFMNRENLKEEEKGYLGVTIKNVTDELINNYQWPAGVLVYSVTEGGPAAKAGILAQDIITKINGSEVKNMDELKEKVNSQRIGTEVGVTLKRYNNGTFVEMEFTVILEANPQPTATPTPEPASEPETDPSAHSIPQMPEMPSEGGQSGGSGDLPEDSSRNPINNLPFTVPDGNGGQKGTLPEGGM